MRGDEKSDKKKLAKRQKQWETERKSRDEEGKEDVKNRKKEQEKKKI